MSLVMYMSLRIRPQRHVYRTANLCLLFWDSWESSLRPLPFASASLAFGLKAQARRLPKQNLVVMGHTVNTIKHIKRLTTLILSFLRSFTCPKIFVRLFRFLIKPHLGRHTQQ